MNSIFVGRQPIVDSVQHVVAYELLFRSDAAAQEADFANRPFACMHVIANTFASMGVGSVLGGCRAFVNVDAEILMSDMIEALPIERVVLEVLEDVKVDERILERCRSLQRHGFTLALDDFVPQDPREPLLDVVDWVKVDLPSLANAELAPLVRQLRGHRVRTLAEKVETRDQFDTCCDAGFDLFQGFFFARPVVIQGAQMDSRRSSLLRLFHLVHGDSETPAIVDTFKRDAALSISLLRLVNSAGYETQSEIGSIEDAVNYLGRRQLARWVLVLLYAGGEAASVRGALLQTAAHRGKLMEHITASAAEADDGDPEQAFLVGMLSLVDTLFACPMAEVLAELGLDPVVHEALLDGDGRLGQVLALVKRIEQADWSEVEKGLSALGLDFERLQALENEAFAWLHEFVGDAPASAANS